MEAVRGVEALHSCHGLSICADPRTGLVLATYPASNRILAIDARRGTVVKSIRTDQAGLLWPSGIEILDERHAVATGYHRGVFFLDRDRLEIVERHTIWTPFFGHSHIAVG